MNKFIPKSTNLLYRIFSSYKAMFLLWFILALGAAIATFIENDFGSARARILVYNALWYEIIIFLSIINLLFVIHRTRMYKIKPLFLFHVSFVLIFIGAGITRYTGYEGTLKLENQTSSNIIFTQNGYKEIPFSIYLHEFDMQYYAGSRFASNYSSNISILDKNMNEKTRTSVSVNSPLRYKGFSIFQTSYLEENKGSVFSINYDPGTPITYFAYAILFIGIITTLLSKKSHFYKLIQRTKNPITSIILFLFCLTPSYSSNYLQTYMRDYKLGSIELSKEFGSLIVQGSMGRMKPMDTLSRELIYKMSGNDSLDGMNANQIILGMYTHPMLWKKVDMIKIKSDSIKKIIKTDENKKLFSFDDFFDENGNYKLYDEVKRATLLKPSQRNTYEHELIRLNDRIDVAFMVYQGLLFKFFPLTNDPQKRWLDFKDSAIIIKLGEKEDKDRIQNSYKFLDFVFKRDFDKSLVHLKKIKEFQLDFGKELMPSKLKVKVEIFINQIKPFYKITFAYFILGILLLILTLMQVFQKSSHIQKTISIINYLAIISFFTHAASMIIRWYISGHAPFANTYESMLYIALSSVLAGLIFFKKTPIVLSSSLIMGSIFMFAASLGNADPQITNLVPVLKSFWLNIHVAVITASYGFFALASALSFLNLILFSCKNIIKKDMQILYITDIIEIAIIIGLVFLVIGNFLGAIWANQSWGRYWAWDPKETWTYISILIYAGVVHFRFLKIKYHTYWFNVLSLISFSSILMTYFGVNFYLAGMHSYANGDPLPIPTWVYLTTIVITLLILSSFKNRS